jgi:hypothetical protein
MATEKFEPRMAMVFDIQQKGFPEEFYELCMRGGLFEVQRNDMYYRLHMKYLLEGGYDDKADDAKYTKLCQEFHAWLYENGYDEKYECLIKVWW